MRRAMPLLALFALGCLGGQPPASAEPPADAGTRKSGDDWPAFLGTLGTGVSREKGIVSPWPAKGPRLVWQKEVGVGYGMRSVSRGRLFQFDRHKDRARLSCLNAETGDFL